MLQIQAFEQQDMNRTEYLVNRKGHFLFSLLVSASLSEKLLLKSLFTPDIPRMMAIAGGYLGLLLLPAHKKRGVSPRSSPAVDYP